MSAKGLVVAAVVVVAVGGVAGAFALDVGPFASGVVADEDDATGASSTTDTPASTGTVYDGGEAGTETASAPPFSFQVVTIEECGNTCRDVTVELNNNQDREATGVEVYTRIYAGNSTDADDKVWEGTESVGTLGAGGSTTSTRRVELSYSDALEVRNNDGWITILTTVESDDTTVTFKERRDVD
ncbi:MAG: hypothetical protein ABEJ79_05195 [Halolamina sp.]